MASAITVTRQPAVAITGDAGPRTATRHPQRQKSPLWVCLRFPDLALESRSEHDPQRRQAIIVMRKGVPTVLAASAAARAAGVQPGIQAQVATAIAGDVTLLVRDPVMEQLRLRLLAGRCANYTPTVSVEQPDTLLLELRASLRLFGGSQALIAQLVQELGARHRLQWAAAPTPLAASLLARAGGAGKSAGPTITDPAALRTALGPLAATLLIDDPRIRKQLQRLGVRCLRDLWRLPRDGLARRFGLPLVKRLDQLLGDAPDLRNSFQPGKRFSSDLLLEFPSDDVSIIMTQVQDLLQQLLDYLRHHDLDAGRIQLLLVPQRGPWQSMTIGARHPGRDPDHWRRLFYETLQRQRLPAPIQQLRLLCDDLRPYSGQTLNWLQPQAEKHSWPRLLDELEARLQRPTKFLSLCADHRPEHAWHLTNSNIDGPVSSPSNPRPLWLLPQPRPLQGQPYLLQGPERIETGWWDGNDCCRDYYIAMENTGRRLWVFHELRNQIWYLHGLFG